MAERSLFFNSVETSPGIYDREYQESDFADYFGSVLSTGLLHIDNLPGMAVSVESGTLNTVVSAGKAIMKGHLYENTTPLTLTHNIPEATMDRIDRIVLRLDLRNQSRFIKLFIKEGLSSDNPVAPDLQRDNFIYEISLAQIRVRQNTVQLQQSDLIDERLITSVCGLVNSLLTVPTDFMQKQWDDWFSSVKNEGFASKQEFDNHVADNIKHITTQERNTWSGNVTTVNSHINDYVKHPAYATTTGTNAYTVSLNPAPTSLIPGMGIVIKVGNTATGPCTLNVNGLGAKSILKSDGSTVNELKANAIYTLRYNGTAFILQGEGGDYGDAIAINNGDVMFLELPGGYIDGILTETTICSYKISKVKGFLRISIPFRSNKYMYTVCIRIYVNGSPIGVEHMTHQNYEVTVTYDINVDVGTLIEIKGRVNNDFNACVVGMIKFKADTNQFLIRQVK